MPPSADRCRRRTASCTAVVLRWAMMTVGCQFLLHLLLHNQQSSCSPRDAEVSKLLVIRTNVCRTSHRFRVIGVLFIMVFPIPAPKRCGIRSQFPQSCFYFNQIPQKAQACAESRVCIAKRGHLVTCGTYARREESHNKQIFKIF